MKADYMLYIYECLSGENGALRNDKSKMKYDFVIFNRKEANVTVASENQEEQSDIWYVLNERYSYDEDIKKKLELELKKDEILTDEKIIRA